MARYLGSCWDVEQALGVKTYCCSSCHYDDDEGYHSLMERWSDDCKGKLEDADWVALCCGGTDAFDEHPDPWPLLRAHKDKKDQAEDEPSGAEVLN